MQSTAFIPAVYTSSPKPLSFLKFYWQCVDIRWQKYTFVRRWCKRQTLFIKSENQRKNEMIRATLYDKIQDCQGDRNTGKVRLVFVALTYRMSRCCDMPNGRKCDSYPLTILNPIVSLITECDSYQRELLQLFTTMNKIGVLDQLQIISIYTQYWPLCRLQSLAKFLSKMVWSDKSVIPAILHRHIVQRILRNSKIQFLTK